MKYTVTVMQSESASTSLGVDTTASQEICRQSFDELDLGKLAIALNQKPRGRPAKKREGAQ